MNDSEPDEQQIGGFGSPQEWRDCLARNERFFRVWPRLKDTMDRVFSRVFETEDAAGRVIFLLGRLAVEDFVETVLLCANGYGIGGQKLLRGLFERVATSRYLMEHPIECQDFVDYAHVHKRKSLNHLRTSGADVAASITAEKQRKIEEEYQAVRGRFRERVCDTCGTERDQMSWTKKDMATLAREAGMGGLYPMFYYWPTLQAHPTLHALSARTRVSERELHFESGAQRKEADYAVQGAHCCMLNLLDGQNRYFRLGLDEMVNAIAEDYLGAWPVSPDDARRDAV